MIKQGLSKGNKVKNQVGVPSWICKKLDYQIACLRGLIDTDGGLYIHRYNSVGKKYAYLKLCFSNSSKPLLNFVFTMLNKLNYKPSLGKNKVSIFAIAQVKRYCLEIKPHNPRQIKKFREYFSL